MASEIGGGGLGFQKLDYKNEDPGTGDGAEVSYSAEGRANGSGGPETIPPGGSTPIPPQGSPMDVMRVVIQVAGGAAAGAHTWVSTGPIAELHVTAHADGNLDADGRAGGASVPGSFQ